MTSDIEELVWGEKTEMLQGGKSMNTRNGGSWDKAMTTLEYDMMYYAAGYKYNNLG